jgi:hypothetical protein
MNAELLLRSTQFIHRTTIAFFFLTSRVEVRKRKKTDYLGSPGNHQYFKVDIAQGYTSSSGRKGLEKGRQMNSLVSYSFKRNFSCSITGCKFSGLLTPTVILEIGLTNAQRQWNA